MEAIVAVYSDWGIGARGTQPIVIPEDTVNQEGNPVGFR